MELNTRMLHGLSFFLLVFLFGVWYCRASDRSHPPQALFLVALIYWHPNTAFHASIAVTRCWIPSNKKAVPTCLEPEAVTVTVLGNCWAGGTYQASAAREVCAGHPCHHWRKEAAMCRTKCSDGSKDLAVWEDVAKHAALTLGLPSNLLSSIALSSVCCSLESYRWDCKDIKSVKNRLIRPWLHLSEG